MLAVVAGLFGLYGYWRGASRFGLALVPLLLASLLLWLLGPSVYRIDALRNAGLIWPGLLLTFVGIIGGYVLRAFLRMKLPKKPVRADRLGGSLIGIVIAVIVVWLGCVSVTALSAKDGDAQTDSSAAQLARTLNNTAIRWIPGIGSGSEAMTNLMDIATASVDARRHAIESLGLDQLADLPEMQAVMENTVTKADVDEAAGGSVTALLRLQKDPRVLKLLESKDVSEILNRHSLEEIAETVRQFKKESGD
jgi:hypothetical protein